MKHFKGKAIYNPSGKAGEYSEWACNFYTGCSNNCDYCYCKRGVMSRVWSEKPKLKSCFKDEGHAMDEFRFEVLKNIEELIKHGLFFSFTTDPMLPETIGLTYKAMNTLVTNGIPIKTLTKRADWVDSFLSVNNPFVCNGKATMHKIAFGFTLTGHDELEQNASTNKERIEAMEKLYDAGFKTFSSIEPIIDFDSSCKMIQDSAPYCDLYKIGLKSNTRYFKRELVQFMHYVNWLFADSDKKVYWKDSLIEFAGLKREDLCSHCVGRDYNLFKAE